jgi:hypothetical protein
MAESVTLFAAVAGVLVLRSRARAIDPGSSNNRTCALHALTYCAVIAVVVGRSAVKHPVQGVVIIIFNGVGIGVYQSRWFQRHVRVGTGLG